MVEALTNRNLELEQQKKELVDVSYQFLFQFLYFVVFCILCTNLHHTISHLHLHLHEQEIQDMVQIVVLSDEVADAYAQAEQDACMDLDAASTFHEPNTEIEKEEKRVSNLFVRN